MIILKVIESASEHELFIRPKHPEIIKTGNRDVACYFPLNEQS